jgi:hypothetical protein
MNFGEGEIEEIEVRFLRGKVDGWRTLASGTKFGASLYCSCTVMLYVSNFAVKSERQSQNSSS